MADQHNTITCRLPTSAWTWECQWPSPASVVEYQCVLCLPIQAFMFMFMFMFLFVFLFMFIYMFMFVFMFVFTFMFVFVFMFTLMLVFVFMFVHVRIHIHGNVGGHVHINNSRLSSRLLQGAHALSVGCQRKERPNNLPSPAVRWWKSIVRFPGIQAFTFLVLCLQGTTFLKVASACVYTSEYAWNTYSPRLYTTLVQHGPLLWLNDKNMNMKWTMTISHVSTLLYTVIQCHAHRYAPCMRGARAWHGATLCDDVMLRLRNLNGARMPSL